MEFVKLIINLKNEIGVERRDVEKESGGFNGIINDFLIQFYFRKEWLKLKDELRSGFTVGNGDRNEVFLDGV